MTPLHRAAWAGDAAAAEKLLKEGADIHARDAGGYTPLHWAADMGAAGGQRAPIVHTLIAAGADINAKDNEGDTPLATARIAEAQEIVDILLAHGATEDAVSNNA